jgi:nitroimidazol reductase NimA-like FMN-containing flavoprotein (pyridoxamine 5'-phosphate oxidase superfamily)
MTTVQPGVTVLSLEECLERLRREVVGRLAVCVRTHPEIFPVNYVVDRGGVVFRTAAGTKLAGAVLGERLAFEVDGVDAATGDAWSVIVKGHAEELERADDVVDALALPLYPWHAAPKHHFVRLDPTEITGRSFAIVDPDWWSEPARTRR